MPSNRILIDDGVRPSVGWIGSDGVIGVMVWSVTPSSIDHRLLAAGLRGHRELDGLMWPQSSMARRHARSCDDSAASHLASERGGQRSRAAALASREKRGAGSAAPAVKTATY
jgi:hypothetical protein